MIIIQTKTYAFRSRNGYHQSGVYRLIRHLFHTLGRMQFHQCHLIQEAILLFLTTQMLLHNESIHDGCFDNSALGDEDPK